MLVSPERRDTLAVLFDQALVSGGNFVTSLVLARVLAPTVYGQYSLILLFLYAINTCHSSVIVYPLILRVARTSKQDLASAMTSSLVLTLLLAVPLALICVAFSAFTRQLSIAPALVAAMTAWQLQETTRRMLLSSQNVSKAILPDLLCFVGQGAVLWFLKPHGLTAILAVIFSTSLLAMAWQLAVLPAGSKGSITRSSLEHDARDAWQLGRHILGGNAFNMVALQLPSWTLAVFGGSVAVAGYQALLNLAGIANPIIFSVNTSLIPMVARSAGQGYVAARRTAIRVGLQYGTLLLPCFLILGLMPKFVMAKLYGFATPYLHLSGLLPMLITAYAIQYVATVIGAYEGGMSRPQSYFRVQSISTVVLALLAIPLVRQHGIRGAVLAILGFSVARLLAFAALSIHLDCRSTSLALAPSGAASPDPSQLLRVTVCVLSYKRTQMLASTLQSLQAQTALRMSAYAVDVIVVDNDAMQSARDVLHTASKAGLLPMRYVSNPANGLATGRNRAFDEAGDADYVAFIDDDETASRDWLELLLREAIHDDAAVVTGPVDPVLTDAPVWIGRGGFFAPPSYTSGTELRHIATNNTLIRKDVVTRFRFDSRFDVSGGEDTDFFLRVGDAGYKMIWCAEARVQETVPLHRATQAWILARARSDANRFTRGYLQLNVGVRHKALRWMKVAGGVAMGAATMPLGILNRHGYVRSLKHFARAAGTFAALRGRWRDDYAEGAPVLTTSHARVPVVVVGQIPPPLNGQTIMIRDFVEGTYHDLAITYVPMRFSRAAHEVGRMDWRKPIIAIATIAAIYRARRTSRADILYYPPAGANIVPVIRDVLILIACRPLFKKTVFHFHAAGLSGIYPRLPKLMRPLFRLAYQQPDLALFPTEATSSEAHFLNAAASSIVPCGVPDPLQMHHNVFRTPADTPTLLFAGILCEGKGVMTLLLACAELKRRGIPFSVKLMGAFQSTQFEAQILHYVTEQDMQLQVELLGVLSGKEKHQAFSNSDVFCFPSHYPAESFGVVLIEAMSHSLPIVATDWQGIPEVTGRDGQGTTLVQVKDPHALANALEELLQSSTKRQTMGAYNRHRYLESYTLAQYRSNLASCLMALAG